MTGALDRYFYRREQKLELNMKERQEKNSDILADKKRDS